MLRHPADREKPSIQIVAVGWKRKFPGVADYKPKAWYDGVRKNGI
jgi:hypothetical protein